MAILLNIDTATENAIICLSQNEKVLQSAGNSVPKQHAGFVQPAISQLLKDCGLSMQDLDAISVTAGPGSYTGLRVGMASAKGLCYALNIPLLTLNTLEAMAVSVMQDQTEPSLFLYCPMMDAGRMEVYTAIYDENLGEIQPPSAIILQADTFETYLNHKQILFCGTGFNKFKSISNHNDFKYVNNSITAAALSILAFQRFTNKNFASLSFAEPLYLKPFFTNIAPTKT